MWVGVGIEKSCECLKSLEEGEECFLEGKYRQHFNEQGWMDESMVAMVADGTNQDWETTVGLKNLEVADDRVFFSWHSGAKDLF